jgi:hypothetical protein
VLPDKLAEEGKVGEVEFGADFLDRLVAVVQLPGGFYINTPVSPTR